jgi:hypothetical protein
MTELETLHRRRELVLLSAELQRATIARRLDRIGANPAHSAFAFAAKVASRPVLLTLGTKAVRLAVNAYRNRAASRRAPAHIPT